MQLEMLKDRFPQRLVHLLMEGSALGPLLPGGFVLCLSALGGSTVRAKLLGIKIHGLTKSLQLPGIGVFQDYYETHQLKDLSPSTIAWIPSLETCMMLLGVCIPLISCIHK
jgi:hypothetical protein